MMRRQGVDREIAFVHFAVNGRKTSRQSCHFDGVRRDDLALRQRDAPGRVPGLPFRNEPEYGRFCADGVGHGLKTDIHPAAFSIIGGRLHLNANQQAGGPTCWTPSPRLTSAGRLSIRLASAGQANRTGRVLAENRRSSARRRPISTGMGTGAINGPHRSQLPVRHNAATVRGLAFPVPRRCRGRSGRGVGVGQCQHLGDGGRSRPRITTLGTFVVADCVRDGLTREHIAANGTLVLSKQNMPDGLPVSVAPGPSQPILIPSNSVRMAPSTIRQPSPRQWLRRARRYPRARRQDDHSRMLQPERSERVLPARFR